MRPLDDEGKSTARMWWFDPVDAQSRSFRCRGWTIVAYERSTDSRVPVGAGWFGIPYSLFVVSSGERLIVIGSSCLVSILILILMLRGLVGWLVIPADASWAYDRRCGVSIRDHLWTGRVRRQVRRTRGLLNVNVRHQTFLDRHLVPRPDISEFETGGSGSSTGTVCLGDVELSLSHVQTERLSPTFTKWVVPGPFFHQRTTNVCESKRRKCVAYGRRPATGDRSTWAVVEYDI